MTRAGYSITIVDLESGAETVVPTQEAAAAFMGVSSFTIMAMMKDHKPRGKYIGFRTGDASKIDLSQKRNYYMQRIKAAKPKPIEKDKDRVALRIDRHTVILVKPENATEEYAAQWRKKRDTMGKRQLKSDDE